MGQGHSNLKKINITSKSIISFQLEFIYICEEDTDCIKPMTNSDLIKHFKSKLFIKIFNDAHLPYQEMGSIIAPVKLKLKKGDVTKVKVIKKKNKHTSIIVSIKTKLHKNTCANFKPYTYTNKKGKRVKVKCSISTDPPYTLRDLLFNIVEYVNHSARGRGLLVEELPKHGDFWLQNFSKQKFNVKLIK